MVTKHGRILVKGPNRKRKLRLGLEKSCDNLRPQIEAVFWPQKKFNFGNEVSSKKVKKRGRFSDRGQRMHVKHDER